MKDLIKNKWQSIILALGIGGIILFEAGGKGDFDIFLSAAQDLLNQKNIYQILYHDYYHYYYDVVFALLLVPLCFLPLFVAQLIWLSANVFFVYRIWKILLQWMPLSLLNDKKKTLFGILCFAFIIAFLRDNFHLTQVTIFILYLTLESLNLILRGKSISGSLILAIGINIKILPIVMVPYLIYRKEWKSALLASVFVIALLLLPSVIIGYDYNQFLLSERWKLINPMNDAHILDTSERSFHSLTTLLATLLVENSGDQYALNLKRNIADISLDNLQIVINVVRGFFIFFTLYFLDSKPFKKSNTKLQTLYELSYLCLIIPLIFPHQQHYAFFFIFPASSYLIFYTLYLFFNDYNPQPAKKFQLKKYLHIAGLFLVFFLMNSHFILGEFNQYYDHFKTLTYGALLLIVILSLCHPEHIMKSGKKLTPK